MDKIHESITEDRVVDLVSADDYVGICLFCGEEADCIEPDARDCKCSSCGMNKVYGAEEILISFFG
jgi:hypothetical protein